MTIMPSVLAADFKLSVQPMLHVENMENSVLFFESIGAQLVFGSRDGDWSLLRFGGTCLSVLAHRRVPIIPSRSSFSSRVAQSSKTSRSTCVRSTQVWFTAERATKRLAGCCNYGALTAWSSRSSSLSVI